MLETEKKMLKMINAMEVVELSQSTITRRALVFALTHEDEDEAFSLFEQLRLRATFTEEEALTCDGYLLNLENLNAIAKMSGQDSVSRDLLFLMSFFNAHRELLYQVLRQLKRDFLYEGLKNNYMNN